MFNLRSLDLNLLTVFEAIYELGTVSSAADHLALSQSAASHALSRLREACKDDLFARTRQGLSPTPVANEMYPAIKQALDALRATLAEASGFDPGTSQRRFRISLPWGRFTCLPGEPLGGCRRQCRADVRYCFSTTRPQGKPS